jgi:predicted phosphoribosyltransferase
MRFSTREAAGEQLAEALKGRVGPEAVVVGLPRGGLPVAACVARHLGAALDLRVVRKIGLPWQPELALGAVAATGETTWNEALEGSVAPTSREELRQQAWHEARDREAFLRGLLPATSLAGRAVIVVDDGVATGMTVLAALMAIRRERPAHLAVAAPVMAPGVAEVLLSQADEVVALAVPEAFTAVGAHYDAFPQLTEADVREVLAPWRQARQAG